MTSGAPGAAQPLHKSPAGQVILSGLPKSELDAYRKWSVASPPRGHRKNGEETVFAVRAEQRVIAAITIDAPFAPAGEQLSACEDVVANIEALALAQPGLFAGPFSHLSADAIVL
jgi:DNA-binding IclR family transcriptional regulator